MQSHPLFLFLLAAAAFPLTACGGPPSDDSDPPSSRGTSIAEIQGDGSVSPLVGQTVTVTGVVTGDFQDGDADDSSNLGGFFIQDATPDGDPATADGIFVFDGNDPATDVSVGDRVTVAGTVKEYFGETQIGDAVVTIMGSGAVTPTDVRLPAAGTAANSDGDLIADLERYEGMLLRFPQKLTVTDLRNLGRFGAVTLAAEGRLYQFTNANPPDPVAYSAHKSGIAMRRVELDDGRRSADPAEPRYLFAGTTPGYSIRNGDTIAGLTGNLRYSRGSGGNGAETWRLMPVVAPRFTSSNPRPGRPDVGGNLKVASFNVLNFFSTIDAGDAVCGPDGADGCRGADSDTELDRQLTKTVSALAQLDADVVGLIELENNAKASLSLLVNALNARSGDSDYDFVDTGVIHDDVIKTGFIYRATAVAPHGAFKLLNQEVDARFNDERNRPALAQTFRLLSNGSVVTVVVNHLKSKGSSCETDGDPNVGDGQGNCSRTRANAAAAMAEWLSGDPTGSGDTDYLIIGDFNAYLREDPITALREAGYKNLLDHRTNPYSFVFDAQAGALDHALASASLVPQVIETIEWHINADEPPLLDYNLEHGRNPALFDALSPYRASDHDPIVIGLELRD